MNRERARAAGDRQTVPLHSHEASIFLSPLEILPLFPTEKSEPLPPLQRPWSEREAEGESGRPAEEQGQS